MQSVSEDDLVKSPNSAEFHAAALGMSVSACVREETWSMGMDSVKLSEVEQSCYRIASKRTESLLSAPSLPPQSP